MSAVTVTLVLVGAVGVGKGLHKWVFVSGDGGYASVRDGVGAGAGAGAGVGVGVGGVNGLGVLEGLPGVGAGLEPAVAAGSLPPAVAFVPPPTVSPTPPPAAAASALPPATASPFPPPTALPGTPPAGTAPFPASTPAVPAPVPGAAPVSTPVSSAVPVAPVAGSASWAVSDPGVVPGTRPDVTSGQVSIGRAAADTGSAAGAVAGTVDDAFTADAVFADGDFSDDAESVVSSVWDSDGEDAASVTSVDTDYSEPGRSATAPDVFAALTGDGVPVGGREGVAAPAAGPAPGDTGFDAVALPVPSAALSPDLPAGNGSLSPAGFRGAVPSSAASPDVVAGGGVVPVLSSDAPSVQAVSSAGSSAQAPSTGAVTAGTLPADVS
ncbi:hypothetical protein AB0941_43105, partial [Streptomyces sp. NPDC013433]